MNQAKCTLAVISVCALALFLPQPLQAQLPDNAYKFDEGFYDKIASVSSGSSASGSADTPPVYYSVILITDDKEDLVNDLDDEYDVRNVFNPEHLDNVITANVRADQILRLASNHGIYKIGDGEAKLEQRAPRDSLSGLSVLSNKRSHGWHEGITQTGHGIVIGALDKKNSAAHVDLPTSVVTARYFCLSKLCSSPLGTATDPHFNKGASIAVGSGSANSNMRGIAHGSTLILALAPTHGTLVYSLNMLVSQNVDLIYSIAGEGVESCTRDAYIESSESKSIASTLALVVESIVKNGIPIFVAAGNDGNDKFDSQACAYNAMAVGNLMRNGDVHFTSSKGGERTFPAMKPDISAVGTNVAGATSYRGYESGLGTSLSTPLVAGAAALLLEKDSTLTPSELKTAMLLGADFGLSGTHTAGQYEGSGSESLKTRINGHGFGKLNIAKSLELVNSNANPNIVSDTLGRSSPPKNYHIHANAGETVKIMVNWLLEPAQRNSEPALPGNTPATSFTNFALEVKYPGGTKVTSNSASQTKEFVFFTAPSTGNYGIKVSIDNRIFLSSRSGSDFTLGSTHAIKTGAPPAPSPAAGSTLSEGFDSLGKWTESGETDWAAGTPNEGGQPTGHTSANKVAKASDCDSQCVLTLTDGINLSGYSSARLSLWRYVDNSLDSGEYLKVDVSSDGGTTWTNAFDWRGGSSSADDTWHKETLSLSGYLTSTDFKVRLVAKMSSSSEDVAVDDVSVSGIRKTTGGGFNPTPSGPDTPSPLSRARTVFSDNFNGLAGWTSSGTLRWSSGSSEDGGDPPGHPSGNKVAKADNCDSECVLTLKRGIDLSGYSSASLSFWRYVDRSLDTGEYLKVDVSSNGGTTWTNAFNWQGNRDDDDTWHKETLSLSGYLTSTDFKVRLVAKMSSSSEDVAVDDIAITGARGSADTVAPTIAAPANITAEATGSRTTVSLGTATARDAVDATPTITNNAPSAGFPLGATTVTWTATDDAGNSASDTQTVTVRDTTAPTITAPSDVTAEATGPATPVRTGTATASDTVDSSVTVTSDAPASFPLGSTTVTWTATDDAGNSATDTQTVTVQDTTAPRVTAPANATLEATAPLTPLGAAQYGTATASDTADSSPAVTSDAPASFPLGDTTITWTATDSSGNSATDAQTVTVRDTTAPRVTAPNNVVTEAVGAATPVQTGAASASDAVDSSPTITNNAPATFPLGSTTVTWTATDDAGNSGTATQTVTVRDTTAPSITAPPDVAAEASGTATAVSLGSASSTDSVDGSVTVTNDAPSGFPLGRTTVTWTATDDSNNSATDTQVITVRDTAPPTIAAPSDVIAEADGRLTAVVLGTATATDSADADVAVTNDAPPGFPLGTTTVTWTATDDAGNSATAAQTITVQDTTAPSVAAPSDLTAEATGASTAVSLGSASSTDSVDGSVTITNDAPTSFPLGRTTVTWTATDDSGNSATDTQTVTVQDTTAPHVTTPPDVTAEAAGTLTAVLLGTATATDSIDGDIAATNDAPTSFPLGDTSVTWTATDSAGNSATATQTVTVRDTTAPAITAPGDVTVEATDLRTPVVLGTATATDSVDPSVDVSNDAPWSWNRPAVLPSADAADDEPAMLAFGTDRRPEPTRLAEADRDAPPAFPLGATTVTWTATDSSGNSATDTQTVTVQDTTPPLVSAPLEAVLEAAGTLTPFGARDYGEATVTDNSGQDIAVSSSAPELFPLGLTVIVYSATDSSGNAGIDVQSVWVGDTTPPVITVPEARMFEATGPLTELGPGDYGTPEITDAFGFSASNDAPASFPLGTTVISHSATDAYANSATAEQTVVLADTTPPGFAAPETAYIVVSSASDAVEFDVPPAEDLVDGAVSVSCDPSPGARLGLGTTTVECTAADGSGNSSAVSFDIEVSLARSGAPPVIVPPPDAVFEATGMLTPLSSVDYGSATATDGAGGTVPVSSDAPAAFPLGATVITYTATATGGLGTGATQVITVRDTTAPDIVAPQNVMVEATGMLTSVVLGTATATDSVDSDIAITSDAPSLFPLGTTVVAYSATDAAGNAGRAEQIVLILDTAGPEIAPPPDAEFEATGPLTTLGRIDYGTATAVDAVDGAVPVAVDAPVQFPLGATVIAHSATDSSGNASSANQTVRIVDTTPPVFGQPANIAVEAEDVPTNVEFSTLTAIDAVGGTLTSACSPAPGSPFPEGTTSVQCTVADGSGNAAAVSFSITVTLGPDTTPPLIAAPADARFEATGPLTLLGTADYGSATATDSRDPSPTVTNNAPESFPLGDTQITWTAADSAGNRSVHVQTVTVQDTTPPSISVRPPQTFEATGTLTALGPISYGNPGVTDALGPVVVTNDAPLRFALGTTVITTAATDAAGNASTARQTVTVSDTTPPSINVPPPQTFEATAPLTPLAAVDYGTATVTDAVGPVAASSDAPGAFPLGLTVITTAATDAAGNSSTAAQLVNLVDTVPPFAAGVAMSQSSTSIFSDGFDDLQNWTREGPYYRWGGWSVSTIPPWYPQAAEHTDKMAYMSHCPYECSIVMSDGIDLTEYTSATLSMSYLLGRYYGPSDHLRMAVSANGEDGWITVLDPETPRRYTGFKDARWGTETIDLSEYLAGDNFKVRFEGLGRDYFLDDVIISGTKRMADNPPEIDRVLSFAAMRGTTTERQVTASDADGDPITLSVSGNPDFITLRDDGGGRGVLTVRPTMPSHAGTNAVAITANANNASDTAMFVVTVGTSGDAAPPVISPPPDAVFEATAVATPLGPTDYGTASATDLVDGTVAVASDALAAFELGTTVITYTATDAAGNASTATQTVTVRDTTPPVFVIQPPARTMEMTSVPMNLDPSNYDIPVATDLFSPVRVYSLYSVPYRLGDHTVIWHAVDPSGNKTSFRQTVTVVDTTPPAITVPMPKLFAADSFPVPLRSADYGLPRYDDLFPSRPGISNDAPASFEEGITVITHTATDSSGNMSVAQQTVIVKDSDDVSPPAGIYRTIHSPSGTRDHFGYAVTDLDGDRVAVGAPAYSLHGRPVGAVYVFDETTGRLLHTLEHPLSGYSNARSFGHTIESMSDDALAIMSRVGQNYIYIYDTNDWERVAEISKYSTRSVGSLSGMASLANGNLATVSHSHSIHGVEEGIMHVFDRNGRVVYTIENPNPEAYWLFGRSLATHQNDILVGAVHRDDYSGIMYRFDGSTGALIGTMYGPPSDSVEIFGYVIETASDGTILTSARLHQPEFGTYETKAYLYDEGGNLLNTITTPYPGFDYIRPQMALTENSVVGFAGSPLPHRLWDPIMYSFDRDTSDVFAEFLPPLPWPAHNFGQSIHAIGDDRVIVGHFHAKRLGNSQYAGAVHLAHVGNAEDLRTALSSSTDARMPDGGTTTVIPGPDVARHSENAAAHDPAMVKEHAIPRLIGVSAAAASEIVPNMHAFAHDALVLRFDSAVDHIPAIPMDFAISGSSVGELIVTESIPYRDTITLGLYRVPGSGTESGATEEQGSLDRDSLSVRIVSGPLAGQGDEVNVGAGTPDALKVDGIQIAGADALADSILVAWDGPRDMDYKVVIAPSSDPRNKYADTAYGIQEYRFIGLSPDTEYEIGIGVRGDDETQQITKSKTLRAGERSFESGILATVSSSTLSGTADLHWIDTNYMGDDRYRVERSVDGGSFAEIEKQPGSKTETTDVLEPGWSGKQVTYRVFEWVGKQKLYSDEVSFVPQAR